MFSALFANFSSAEAKGNCQQTLAGKFFNCSEKYSGGNSDTACYEFETGGESADFDLYIDNTGSDYGCACDTTGSFKSPKFDSSSSSFECISLDTGFLLNGKGNSKKISGQGTYYLGEEVDFSCTVSDTSCF